MSDISIEFDWYFFPLILVFIGWPGLVAGGFAGGYLWRRHRIFGIVVGALAGTALWSMGVVLRR
jgi:hypothetical protein